MNDEKSLLGGASMVFEGGDTAKPWSNGIGGRCRDLAEHKEGRGGRHPDLAKCRRGAHIYQRYGQHEIQFIDTHLFSQDF